MPSRRTKAGAEDGEEIGLRRLDGIVVGVLEDAWRAKAAALKASGQKEKPTVALKAGLVFLKRMKGE